MNKNQKNSSRYMNGDYENENDKDTNNSFRQSSKSETQDSIINKIIKETERKEQE